MRLKRQACPCDIIRPERSDHSGHRPLKEGIPIINDPCDVVVVFALAEEAGGLVDRIADVSSIKANGFVVRRGVLGEAQVAVVEAGVGQAGVARAVPAVLAAHKPRLLISAGFAGGLVDELKRGDIFLADSVVYDDQPEQMLDDQHALIDLPTKTAVHRGRLVSVDKIVRLPDDKRELGQRLDAHAVDMETYPIAAACEKRATPMLSVRIIFDEAADEISADIAHIGQQASKVGRVGAAIGSLFRRPSSVKDMLRLREQALVASDTLADFLLVAINKLVSADEHLDTDEGSNPPLAV